MSVAPGDPTLVPGFEYHTLKCLDCGDTEQRLVFGQRAAQEAEAPTPSVSTADRVQHEHVALPTEQRLVFGHEEIRAAQDLSAEAPTPSVSTADRVQHEHAAIPNAWAQELEKLQQRCAALAQKAARERAAEIGKRAAKAAQRATRAAGSAAKAAIAMSPKETKEFDRLADSLVLRAPPLRAASSPKAAAIAKSLEEAKGFDQLWDSLAVRTQPPVAPTSSPQQVSQPDALTQTPQPDLVTSVPARSQRSEEHQTPRLPATLRDSAAPLAPSEPQGQQAPGATPSPWAQPLASRSYKKDAILQVNADGPTIETQRVATLGLQLFGMLRRLIRPR
jgi:hypothetical protein